ncbi:uncharacterized protein LOC131263089 [Anopheles coustani]|uniref:uncharacterized protein LOC131263089 n=1 Tax=Anopheles coustani TaxID=139045 RepID=UPI00265A10DD|nr:uncharacterized protein LOC131263089 [Anopheles coustani]
MDSMSFDYDQYFSEETFVIDDFGEICEDIVRIASASSAYLYKDLDSELRHDSPPPGSFIASNRCFEKEVPSLFSEMEYLTEVSPETDAVLFDQKPATRAVNPTEFSCKRLEQTNSKIGIDSVFAESSPIRSDSVIEPAPTVGKQPEKPVKDTPHAGIITDPLDYQRILNNYLQKGRRKLEASSYSKMKASCQAKEKMHTRSTSVVETVTNASITGKGRGSSLLATPIGSSNYLPNHGSTNNNTATVVKRLAFPSTDLVLPHTADPARLSESGIDCQLPSSPTLHRGLLNRPIASSMKTATPRAYRCQDCNVSFPSSELLRKHTCIISEQYQCHLCLREFKKRKTLDHHMKSHDKVFSTDDDLRR